MKLKIINTEIFDRLGFTRTQKSIITYISVGTSTNEIADILEVTPNAILAQNRKILERGRQLFPINTFRSAQDIVDYLKAQKII